MTLGDWLIHICIGVGLLCGILVWGGCALMVAGP